MKRLLTDNGDTTTTTTERVDQTRHHIDQTLELMATLPFDALHPLYIDCKSRLTSLHKERGEQVTAQFMAQASDILVSHVMNALARTLHLGFMLTLRLVSKQWRQLVSQVDHITTFVDYPKQREPTIQSYSYLFSALFPRTTSLKAPLELLCIPVNMLGELSRMTELRFKGSLYDALPTLKLRDTEYTPSLEGWSSLRVLEIPRRLLMREYDTLSLPGLAGLSKLTRLEWAYDDIVASGTSLDALTNLTSLTIKRAPCELDLVTMLPGLVYLSSDQPRHFSRYTGRGRLEAVIVSAFQSITNADFEVYGEGCHQCLCEGSWEQGVFTGQAKLSYWCSDSPLLHKVALPGKDKVLHQYEGAMVAGRKHGRGIEYIDAELIYEGEWVQGVKHGEGLLRERSCLVEGRQWSTAWQPLSSQLWEHGLLISETALKKPVATIPVKFDLPISVITRLSQ
jgi:hypothetical protein